MASFPPVEAVVRTMRLLESLNRHPVSSIAQLHRQTGLPKPSLVRLLQTLEGLGYVRHAPQPGGYLLTSKVRILASGYHSEPRLVEIVAPLLDALTEKIKWPSALSMPDDGAAVVRYTTTPNSPLALLHSTIGMRLSLLTRALGLAYLAFCEPQEREALISLADVAENPENAAGQDRRRLDSTIELIRRQGYALRDPKVRPVSNTLAIPVFDAHRVVGAVGITWFASTMSADEAVERYLGLLQEVAAQAKQALIETQAQPEARVEAEPEAKPKKPAVKKPAKKAQAKAGAKEAVTKTQAKVIGKAPTKGAARAGSRAAAPRKTRAARAR
jgi:IclR family mhp operon transcriptional activator